MLFHFSEYFYLGLQIGHFGCITNKLETIILKN